MMVEAYIALIALGLMLVAGVVLWADRAYQQARRAQRRAHRAG